jgi:uncharacterized membrane protein
VSRLAKYLPIALAVSVLVNVFFLGWGATHLARRHGGPGGSPDRHTAPLMHQLWSERAPRLRALREAVDVRRAAVVDALRREPFDPGALDASLLALRTATTDGQLELHQSIAEIARQLPVEERRHLAASRWVLGLGPGPGPSARGDHGR